MRQQTPTLKRSRYWRVWKPGCLYVLAMSAFLVLFSGTSVVISSSLRPLAMWFSSSTWLRRTLAVDQFWVRATPLFLSDHLASRSPLILSVWWSRTPTTLNATLLGVVVLTSRVEP